MTLDLFAALTVLPPPSGARVERDLEYLRDERGPLHMDAYRPASSRAA
jgi:hypothetical protein